MIELTAVITIIGVMTTIALAGFTGFSDYYRLRLAVAELYSCLDKARQRAITEQQSWGVRLLSPHSYGLFCQSSSDYSECNQLDEAISVNHSAENQQTVFYPLGTASPGTFILTSRLRRRMEIAIATSGRIRIEVSADEP